MLTKTRLAPNHFICERNYEPIIETVIHNGSDKTEESGASHGLKPGRKFADETYTINALKNLDDCIREKKYVSFGPPPVHSNI